MPLLDNEPLVTGSSYFLGIAANAASHTASADGRVEVYIDVPGTIYAAAPKTAGAANTRGKLDSYQFYRIVIDKTSGKYTADLAADSKARGFVVVGGDPDNDKVWFVCQSTASWLGMAKQDALQ